MSKVFLIGYKPLDFPAKDDPNRRIKGYNLFLCIQAKDIIGVIPVSDGGKRFVSDTVALDIGMSKTFLDENLYDFINLDIDFNGKIVGCAALADEEKKADDYPF